MGCQPGARCGGTRYSLLDGSRVLAAGPGVSCPPQARAGTLGDLAGGAWPAGTAAVDVTGSCVKPEDWANLQVGAWAGLPSLGVLWAQPRAARAGGPLTPGDGVHTCPHPRPHTRAHEPLAQFSLPCQTYTGSFLLTSESSFTLIPRSTPSAHALHTHICALVGTPLPPPHATPTQAQPPTEIALQTFTPMLPLHVTPIHTHTAAPTHTHTHMLPHSPQTCAYICIIHTYSYVLSCPDEHRCHTFRTLEFYQVCVHTHQSCACIHAFPGMFLISMQLSAPYTHFCSLVPGPPMYTYCP